MRLTPSTLSFAFAIASVGLLVAAPLPSQPAQAATAAASASPSAKPKASPSQSSDPCGDAKSKWAHLKCEQFNASAPGDEYFGRMKLSYLGIDNTYKDGSISAGDYTTDPHLISKLDFATDALRRWAAKYPNDPQLARSYFLGVLVMRKVYTQPEQQTSWEFTQILVKKYPNTYFGKTAKASMAQGYVEHWYALAEICPTPLPRGVKVAGDGRPDGVTDTRTRKALRRADHAAMRAAVAGNRRSRAALERSARGEPRAGSSPR